MSIPIPVIFGCMNLRVVTKQGSFLCPCCKREERFKRKSIWQFFHLYFIPILPIQRQAKYVKCGRCKSYFETSIIKDQAKMLSAISKAVVLNAMLKCMIWVTLADGIVADSEVELLHETMNKMSENELSKEAIKEAVESAEDEVKSGELERIIREIAPILSNEAKKLVLQASLAVAAADGEIDASEEEVVKKILHIFAGDDVDEKKNSGSKESPDGTENTSEESVPNTPPKATEPSSRIGTTGVNLEEKPSPTCVVATGA